MRRGFLVGATLTAACLTARLVACADFGADPDPEDGGPFGEAGSEASTLPDGDPPDGADAGADVELPPLCSRVDATFCWTFENEAGAALVPDFPVGVFQVEKPVGYDASPPTASAARFVSAPAAMRTNAVTNVYSRMVHRVVPTPQSLHHCEVDLFVEKVGDRSTSVMQFGGTLYTPSVVLTPTSGKVSMFFFGLPTPGPQDLGNFVPNKWMHLVFEASLVSKALSLRGSFDGRPMVEHPASAPDASLQDTATALGLALDSSDPNATEWIVWYDNYWCHSR